MISKTRWSPEGAISLVTGASSGIGWHLALQLCSRGSTVFATARRLERLRALQTAVADSGRGAIVAVPGDITDPGFRDSLVEKIRDEHGKLDLLVNNAGVGGIGRFAEASQDRLRKIMEVNFFAPVELTRASLSLLSSSKNSVICNISSVLGHRAVPYKSEYCASKFAIHGWSDALRAELAESGIKVCLVSPSTTSSEFFGSILESSDGHSKDGKNGDRPERVANVALRAIIKGRDEVILTLGGKALVYLDRLCPWLMNRVMAHYATKDDHHSM